MGQNAKAMKTGTLNEHGLEARHGLDRVVTLTQSRRYALFDGFTFVIAEAFYDVLHFYQRGCSPFVRQVLLYNEIIFKRSEYF